MQPLFLYSILLMKLLSPSEVVLIEKVKSGAASSACHAWVVRGDEEGGTG